MCMFCISLFALFLLTIMLSVLLLFTDSDYHFDIFKLFLAIVITFKTLSILDEGFFKGKQCPLN
jgi:hypothetical protein